MEDVKPPVEACSGPVPSRLYTKLKFQRSERNDNLIGFVSINNKTGRVKGVREDSQFPKRICIVDRILEPYVLPGILYDVELAPMNPKRTKTGEMVVPGYVVVTANPVQFKAKVEVFYKKHVLYLLKVSFGNKTLRFNPFQSRKDAHANFESFKKELEARKDIKNLNFVIADVVDAANELIAHMEEDQAWVRSQREKGIREATRQIKRYGPSPRRNRR